MRVKITAPGAGAFTDNDGNTVAPGVGNEVDVPSKLGKAMIDAGQAEEVKPKRGGKAKTGPEETREK